MSCLTPGCKYFTRISSYDFKRNATLKVEVDLPSALKIPKIENVIGGAVRHDKYLKQIEDILHAHMEAAVAAIGQLDLTYGGTLAKSWPVPVRDEIGGGK